jgi:hypothetical protein
LTHWALGHVGSGRLGHLGFWALALLELELLFDNSAVVSSAFSLLPFCGTSLPSGCKVLRFNPLGSWAHGLFGSWALGLFVFWGLALLDLERLFDNSAIVGVVSSSLEFGCKVLGSWALGGMGSWALGLLGTTSGLGLLELERLFDGVVSKP